MKAEIVTLLCCIAALFVGYMTVQVGVYLMDKDWSFVAIMGVVNLSFFLPIVFLVWVYRRIIEPKRGKNESRTRT